MRQYWDWNYDRPQSFLPTWEARQMLKGTVSLREKLVPPCLPQKEMGETRQERLRRRDDLIRYGKIVASASGKRSETIKRSRARDED